MGLHWTWSWITLAALVGSVTNVLLATFLIWFVPSTMRSRVCVTAEAVAYVPRASSIAMQMLLDLARRRRLLIWLGAILQACAFFAAGLKHYFTIPWSGPAILQTVGLITTVVGYAKWRRCFDSEVQSRLTARIAENIEMASKGDLSYLKPR